MLTSLEKDIRSNLKHNVAANLADGGLFGAAFTGFGLWQLNWLGLQAVLLIALGGFLLYAAGANYFEGRKYK